MDENIKNMITVMYSETQSHLRATDEKRDKIVWIFFMIIIAISTALIGLSNSQSKETDSIFLVLGILISLLIIGEVFIFAMINSRKWHAEYMNVSIILQKIMITNELQITDSFIPEKKKEPFYGSFLTSRSFVIIQFGIVWIFALIGYFLEKTRFGIWTYLIVSNLAFLSAIANRHISISILNKAEKKFWNNPLNTWIISGLEFTKEISKKRGKNA